MATYKLTLTNGSNSYLPLFLIEETDGGGTLLEDAGVNLFMSGDFDCKYRPESLSMDITTKSGRSMSFVWGNIDTYDILGDTTNASSIYTMWDLIASRTATNI